MVPPVAAPDEIVELHDALVATPLDDVETLRRLAWRARAIAAKRPRDFRAALEAGFGLAKSGQHCDAIPYVRRAFDLRVSSPASFPEIAFICLDVGLFDQAIEIAEDICEIPAFSNDFSAIKNASGAALLAGSIELLAKILSFSSKKLLRIPEQYINTIEVNELSSHIHCHMNIINRHIVDACCNIDIHNANGDLSFHIDYYLGLPFDECLKRFDALGEELRAYYIAAGRDDLPYLNAISHSLWSMPAYWVDAA